MPRPPQTSTSPADFPTEGRVTLRARFNECDPLGVVHHAASIPWLEIGRSELLRDGGFTHKKLESEGVHFVITRLDVTYRRPMRYDDLVEVRTRVASTTRVKIRHAYEIAVLERDGKAPDGTDPAIPADGVCLVAQTELAVIDKTGRPIPLPSWLVVS